MLENADSDGYMVGVLAVPSWMTPSDFLAFVAPAQDGMAHLRMIRYVSLLWMMPILMIFFIFDRDTSPNRSIALIKFRNAESAFEFAEVYNGKTFNSMNVSSLVFGFFCNFFSTASPARDLSCRSYNVREHRRR
jgi:BRCA1-associated protein